MTEAFGEIRGDAQKGRAEAALLVLHASMAGGRPRRREREFLRKVMNADLNYDPAGSAEYVVGESQEGGLRTHRVQLRIDLCEGTIPGEDDAVGCHKVPQVRRKAGAQGRTVREVLRMQQLHQRMHLQVQDAAGAYG